MASRLGIGTWMVALGLLVLAGCHKAQPPGPPAANQEGPAPPESGPAPVVTSRSLKTPAAAPFELQVSPNPLKAAQAGLARVKVAAVRKGYDGAIAVEVRNLPGGVTAGKATIDPGQKEADLEVQAAAKAVPGDTPDVYAQGTAVDAGDQAVPSASFTLSVNAAEPSFEMKVDPDPLKLAQGGKAKLKVLADRKTYQGPITVKLLHLPKEVTAAKATIGKGNNSVDVEVTATTQARAGDYDDLKIQGTATDAANQLVGSPTFTLTIQSTQPSTQEFELKVENTPVHLKEGGKAKVKVVATRQGYEGPIRVELHNLPAHVKGPQGSIDPGSSAVEIELTADNKVTQNEQSEAHALGVATAANDKQVVSGNFAVDVEENKQHPQTKNENHAAETAFHLQVRPGTVHLVPGGGAAVLVDVNRQEYQGAILVELRDLPKDVAATKAIAAPDQNLVELVIEAAPQAEPGEKADVFAQGITDTHKVDSPHFKVVVSKKK